MYAELKPRTYYGRPYNSAKMYMLSVFLQMLLASLVMAAPVHIESNSWQYGTGGGIIGFIVFILDVIAIGKATSSS